MAVALDLMVYHANTHQHGAPPHNNPVNYQSAAALLLLDAMHTNAQGDYAALPAPNNLALHNVASLAKHAYYLNGFLLEQRKANQRRGLNLPGGVAATPEFAAGCSLMGFFGGGAWHFYYQTWGGLDYTSPSGVKAVAKDLFTFHWKPLHKLRTQGKSHSAFSSITVVDHALIY